MNLRNTNLNLFAFGLLVLTLFVSCNNGDYLQEYENYNEFTKIKNPRLTGWFPVELIKSDAENIKNVSYLSTKCVFGVFDYENEELYDSIFSKENHIDKTHNEIFHSQIELVKNIIPEWFPKVDYWKTKENGIILFDKCYAYKDLKRKQIYYFHPEEESTKFNGKMYTEIRKTIR
jgi:hypothetical protein